MRSQHLVMQELEQIRQEMNFRGQQSQFHNKSAENANDTVDGPNLTNPKRVKKLTKFFGEDPPLMRLFLKKVGYEVRLAANCLINELILILNLLEIRCII